MEQLDPLGLDPVACYRALKSRDARFDGRFFVGVTSTGIYCRPVCPARTPKFENCRFFPSRGRGAGSGLPPLPALPAGDGARPRLLARHLEHGVARPRADRGGRARRRGASVDALAERLGIGERQLRRLFQQHLGASPVTVAQTRRVLFAKQLIHETRLPMAEIALAAGFGSIRRFNETFQQLFRRPPSALRRKAVARSARRLGRRRSA